MDSKDGSSGHGQLRDLTLAKLEEKRKELEKSRRQVEDEIQRFQNEIQRIQSEVQRSECDLDRIDLSLKENRAEYGKIVNGSSALLNLPTEVTCMIFELSSSTHNLGNPRNSEEKSPMLPEVVTSQVCTRWRDIALSCASLWTRFYFSLDRVKSTSISNTVTRFDAYLKRSGSRNLELFLNFRQCPRVKLSRKEHDQLLDMALKHINRWKFVTLLVHQDLDLDARLPSLLTASAPELEYFVYSSTRVNYSSNISINPSSFLQGGAPKLRHLQLNCSPLYIPPSANITTLHLELKYNSDCLSYSWETFLAILSMPLLANLSIVGDIFVAPDHKPIVNMNNLKHLRYSDNEDMSHILPILRAPLLKTLVIHYSDGFNLEEEAPQQNPPELAENSYFFPSLETLVFLESFPSSASFAGYIPHVTRNIKSITACLYSETENFPWANERAVEWWPKLTSITLLNGPLCDAHELEATSAFILGRKKLNVRLSQTLHFDLEYFYPAEHEAIRRTYSLEVLDNEAQMVLWNQTRPPGFNFPEYAVIEREDPFQMEEYM